MARIAYVWIALPLLTACAEDTASGTLQVMLRGEETITAGLAAGDALDDVVDGWDVGFDTWVATVGHVHIDRTDGEAGAFDAPEVHVVDLRGIPSSGVEIARFADIPAGRWDVFEYETPAADDDARRDDSVGEQDFESIVAMRATYLIEGTLTSEQGRSCPPSAECRDASELTFSLSIPADTVFGPCSAEGGGLAGAVVNEGGITTVAVTLHGDHMLFDRFPGGAERVERRAQWLADADLDGDDRITQAELESIDAADLFDSQTYTLGGGPSEIEIVTAWDYLRAQLKTTGHFQGEGECPVDGSEHH